MNRNWFRKIQEVGALKSLNIHILLLERNKEKCAANLQKNYRIAMYNVCYSLMNVQL